MAEGVIHLAVAIIEDTPYRAVYSMLEHDPRYSVTSVGSDLHEAEVKILQEQPGLVLVLVHKPQFSLKSWMSRISNKTGIPFLVLCTEQPSRDNEEQDEPLLQYMCVRSDPGPEMLERELAIKMRLYLNRINARRKLLAVRQALVALQKPAVAAHFSPVKLIAIGASMGGVEALGRVLEVLPAEMPGIVVVQHMPKGFTEMYAKHLDHRCKLQVMQAKDRQRVEAGTVYIAPGDFQMEIVKVPQDGYSIKVRQGEKVTGHRPSVDVLFRSVAKCAGSDALGIILTGMGEDGAQGLLEMRKVGADTIGQDAATALVYGMPRVAFEKGAVKKQLALMEIPHYMVEYAYR